MFGIVIGLVYMMTDGVNSAPTPDELTSYQAARAKAGRSAEAHVSFALWCEAHGMTAERLEHLAMAVTADPTNAAARGLMGLVDDLGRWRRPEDVTARDLADPERARIREEYADRRSKAANTADSQWNLAVWCEQNGLKDEARAHLATVVRLDPGRTAAWKRLGCKKVDGRWVSDEQIADRKAEIEATRAADRLWTPRFARLKADLKKASTRDAAMALVASISDPRCVPALLKTFATNDPRDLAILVQVLGQTDGVRSSRALAYVAMNADDAEIRRTASETLRRRDPREFADDLIAAIRPAVKYQVQPVGGPGSPGILLVEGKEFDRRRFYAPPSGPTVTTLNAGDRMTTDEQGLPVLLRYLGEVELGRGTVAAAEADLRRQLDDVNRRPTLTSPNPVVARLGEAVNDSRRREIQGRLAEIEARPEARFVATRAPRYEAIPVGQMEREARRGALAAQQQLEADIQQIEAYNRMALIVTERATDVLKAVSGQDHGENQEAWSRWSADARGYAMVMPSLPVKSMVDEVVPLAFTPAPIATSLFQGQSFQQFSSSCFAAGTLVRTRTGDRPIETLAVGDLALVQDPSTGLMSFQPIVAVYHNPPDKTLRLKLGEETIVATGIHRFWKAGEGWTMARDLKSGDLVRTASGTVTVSTIEPGPTEPVFNLEVARGRSFFVGKLGALVHDFTLVETVSKPFDAVPSLAKAKTEGASRR